MYTLYYDLICQLHHRKAEKKILENKYAHKGTIIRIAKLVVAIW